VERLGERVTIVPCSPMNLKITTKDDLRLASAVLKILPRPRLGGNLAFSSPGQSLGGGDLFR
jgi:hypothetical protein